VIKDVVEAYGQLEKRDLRVLRMIEAGHRRYEFVPQEVIERWCRCRREEVAQIIRRLHYLGLLRRNTAPYLGWRITAQGYDVLAIHTLRVKRKVLKLSPTPVGVGKEAVVYVGESPSGFKLAVKFHRGGVSVFRYEKAFQRLVKKYAHLAQVYETRLSALAEYFALEKVFEAGGHVPEPIAVNRHVVVMAYVDGVELYRCRSCDFRRVAEDVLETVVTALRIGIVHGDLSPYNVIAGERGYVIDWPQWMPTDSPGAEAYLRRDLENISAFFRRVGVELQLKDFELGHGMGDAFVELINKNLRM